MAVSFHNLLLNQAVTKLRNETGRDSSYVFLDLYSSFTTVLQNKGEFSGSGIIIIIIIQLIQLIQWIMLAWNYKNREFEVRDAIEAVLSGNKWWI